MSPSNWNPDFDGHDTGHAPEQGGGPASESVRLTDGRDYTADVLDFLRDAHGTVRRDDLGDYYYDRVSSISLHGLLSTGLPRKEVLWAWYAYFDRECAESIYQTVPPLRDEVFLRILADCPFHWDGDAVRRSGLVFLSHHRSHVFSAMEGFLNDRVEAHRQMDDEALRRILTPKHTWSDAHLRREVRRIQTRAFSAAERQQVYDAMESDYLRATARHLMDDATTEAFWKHPPPELEAVGARFKALRGKLAQEAVRLGVFVTRDAYERTHWRDSHAGRQSRRGRRRGDTAWNAAEPAQRSVAEHFAVLGLTPSATLAQVKQAYREQVKAHHPDSGGVVAEFLKLQEAYEFLLTRVF